MTKQPVAPEPEEEIIEPLDDDPNGPKIVMRKMAMEEKHLDHKINSQKSFLERVIQLFAFTNIFILSVVFLCMGIDSYFIAQGLITAEQRLGSLRINPVNTLQALKSVVARGSLPLMALVLNKSYNAANAGFRACPSGLL